LVHLKRHRSAGRRCAPGAGDLRGPGVTHFRCEVGCRPGPRHNGSGPRRQTVSVSTDLARPTSLQRPPRPSRTRRDARALVNPQRIRPRGLSDATGLSCDRNLARSGTGAWAVVAKDVRVYFVVGSIEERKGPAQLIRDILPRILADVPNVGFCSPGGAKTRGDAGPSPPTCWRPEAGVGRCELSNLLTYRLPPRLYAPPLCLRPSWRCRPPRGGPSAPRSSMQRL